MVKDFLDLATIALIGFTAVVAAWMVVRGLRRTSTRLMVVVGGIIVLAGALQLANAIVPAPASAITAEPPPHDEHASPTTTPTPTRAGANQ